MRVTQDVFIAGKTGRREDSDHNFSIFSVLTPSRQLFLDSLIWNLIATLVKNQNSFARIKNYLLFSIF